MTLSDTVAEVPLFRMILPEGWAELPATRETMATLVAQGKAVFRSQHRPDLDSEFTRMMEQATRRMTQAGVFAIYLQTAVPADDVLPVSMTASVVKGRLGGTLDRQVNGMFREKDATFLTDDQSIIRWSADVTQAGEFAGVTTRTMDYLIAVPGSGRRAAVQFTTVVPYPAGDTEALELVDEIEALSDTVVSTFTWEPQPQ